MRLPPPESSLPPKQRAVRGSPCTLALSDRAGEVPALQLARYTEQMKKMKPGPAKQAVQKLALLKRAW